MSQRTQQPNVGLDLIRGFAALLVVLGHARQFLGSGLSMDLLESPWQKVLLFPASVPQESVAVFFVLSGYLVGGQVLRQFQQGRFAWPEYLAKRLSRLWTVLIPGLALTLVVDSVTVRVAPAIWDRFANGSVDAGSALCNAAFLQSPYCNPYGTNDSLWSLAFEFWFYILFPAGLAVLFGIIRKRWVSAVTGMVVGIAVVAMFGPVLIALIPAWLLGALIGHLHNGWNARGLPAWFPGSASPVLIVGLIALTVAAMLVSFLLVAGNPLRFLIVGVACAPLIIVTAVHPWTGEPRVAQMAASLGTISFSLYVFHLPIVKLMVGVLSQVGDIGVFAASAAVYGLASVVTVMCISLWAITERNTPLVRDLLLRVLNRPSFLTAP